MAKKEYKTGFEITDEQWAVIEPLLPEPEASENGGPKPVPNRPCFEGVLWVLRSGARWKDLPKHFPSASTCWRRLQAWEEADVLLDAWRALLGALDAAGQLKWHECFADGTFSSAKKGVNASAKPNAERVQSLWWWRMARVCLWEYNLPRRRRMKSR
jgi:transposase